MNKLARAMVGAAIATVSVAGTLVTASTSSAATWDHVWSGDGVRVYIKENNDYISVCDTSGNGHSAALVTYKYTITVSSGKGTCQHRSASQGSKYNLPEKQNIEVSYAGTGGRSDTYYWKQSGFYNDH
ncbi:hypothetical protein [Streptomyces sp. NPDC046925]|uniref:hypothetical protein n=1 Tax=Streptomyces sp. NPDC046925 TaxID=3155375 RepID=UPI0033DBE2AF